MIDYKIAIVISQFNQEISDKLLEGAINAYKELCNNLDNITVYKVPGAFEVPGAVSQILTKMINYDAIVTLGAVIKGETAHFEYISESVTNSISKLSLEARIPIIYGILNSYDYNQAIKRASYNKLDKGGEAMKAAFEVIETYRKINN